MNELCRKGFRIAQQSEKNRFCDIIGFGGSDKPGNFSYLLKEQAKVIERAIDLIGFDKFHLVAHSMGGIIGIELGEMIPNRLRSFINIEGNITAEDCTMSKRARVYCDGDERVDIC